MRKHYFKVAAPCRECPFVNGSPPGWLGPDGVEDVLRKAHGEGGYACHMSIAAAPVDDAGLVDLEEHGHQCTGALLHASKTNKVYRDKQLGSLQVQVEEQVGPTWIGRILGWDFREYHNRLLERVKRRRKG